MKKVLMALTLLLTLSAGVDAAAQKHRHTPQPGELVDTTQSADAVEAFSDTTSAALPTTDWDDQTADDMYDPFESRVESWAERLVGSLLAGELTFAVVVLLCFIFLLLLSPILIIIALVYLVNKNRKQRLKLAQMAVQQGQPIPGQLLENRPADVADEYQRGMRQLFVGVGLMIFLGYAAGEVGFGIGALVACIGLGKIAASKLGKNKERTEL